MKGGKIYFLLTDTGTVLNRLVKLYTNEPFNHVSIALDEGLSEVYSFGRKKYYNPFIGGFVRENIRDAIFINANCVLYSFEVDSESYDLIKTNIKKFYDNKDKYSYNVLGLIGFMFNMDIKRSNSYFCSEFVSSILKESGLNVINKPAAFTKPGDFMKLDNVQMLYEGKLCYYRPSL